MSPKPSRSGDIYWCVLGYYNTVVISITGPYAGREAAEDAHEATERANKASFPGSAIRYEVQPMTTPAAARATTACECEDDS